MKLVDILNEVEQNEVVTEVVTPQVDEIGKFFVVTKPIGKMDDVYDLIKEFLLRINFDFWIYMDNTL